MNVRTASTQLPHNQGNTHDRVGVKVAGFTHRGQRTSGEIPAGQLSVPFADDVTYLLIAINIKGPGPRVV